MSYTYRRQPRIGREDQLTSPEQLEVGMPIAVAALVEGPTFRDRAIRATAALAISYGREEDEGRLHAAKRAWQFTEDHGLLPQWMGTVEGFTRSAVGVDGVLIAVTAMADHESHQSFIGKEPDDLPLLERPARLYESFESMGLEPIRPPRFHNGLEARPEDIGRWNPNVTFRIDR